MGVHQLTVTLPDEIVELVRTKVASGEYASESDVVVEGVQTLAARDQALETWLQETVVPAYDLVQAYPDCAVGADHVRSRIRALRNS